ncbi:IQ-domain 3 [Zea mays]|uniref:IQ-domain 3 n=1 Tax=Zea mays TaxID=4577 RepID=A0A1D6LGU2_MAIZE|nr:IQ-domain 3 [Zea mays]
MGKKGKWFGAVKKVFSPESKEKKEERLRRKSAASNPAPVDLTPSTSLEVNVSVPPPPAPPPVPRQTDEVRVPEAEQEQSKHVTLEEAPAAAAAPAQASVLPPGAPTEELAAIKIQQRPMAQRRLRKEALLDQSRRGCLSKVELRLPHRCDGILALPRWRALHSLRPW